MKLIRIISIVLFASIIAVPLAWFNTTPNSISSIDNRTLTENPFKLDGDLTSNIQNYVNDRIGFRDEMITGFTLLNDVLFKKMVHPSYTYGKDDYVFGAGLTTSNNFGEFHVAFADMVAEIQTYCTERNVPFLFVFNPAKPAVYQDKIAAGVNYNREWVELFFSELDKRGVNYLDNTETMLELRENGIDGFNQKYDANHWNDLGAFYCTEKILESMQELCNTVHVNELDEFTISETLQTSLPVSKFPINEYVPALSLNVPTSTRYNDYFSQLDINPSYSNFDYCINNSDKTEKTPKALVFQGSYMNGHGSKYMQNAFKEYIRVHDYQNVINFPYYFNIFQPECVIFEVAEYTFANKYFDYENMRVIDYNPALPTVAKDMYSSIDISNEDIIVDEGVTLTKITWNTDQVYPYVWMALDNIYDMQRVEGGYQVTIETKRYELSKDSIEIFISMS